MSITESIPYIQIVLSVLLIGGILLQQSEAGLGAGLGGGDGFSQSFHTKRGAEKAEAFHHLKDIFCDTITSHIQC